MALTSIINGKLMPLSPCSLFSSFSQSFILHHCVFCCLLIHSLTFAFFHSHLVYVCICVFVRTCSRVLMESSCLWTIISFSLSGQSGPLKPEEHREVMRDMMTDLHHMLTHTHAHARKLQAITLNSRLTENTASHCRLQKLSLTLLYLNSCSAS